MPGGSRAARAGYRARTSATVAVVLLIGVLVAFPLLRLAAVVRTEGGDLGAVMGSPGLGTAVRNTLLLALAVTVAAVPVGVALALVAAAARSAGTRLLARSGPAASAGARLRPRLQLDAGLRAGRLHRHRARAVLAGRPRPGRGVAGPRRERRSPGLSGGRRRDGRPGGTGSRAGRPGLRRERRDGAAHDHPPARPPVDRGLRRPGVRAHPGDVRDPAGAGGAGRVQHRDDPHLRRPVHRRRPGVVRRGGDPRPAARRSSRLSASRRPTPSSAPGCGPPGRPGRRGHSRRRAGVGFGGPR